MGLIDSVDVDINKREQEVGAKANEIEEVVDPKIGPRNNITHE